MVRAGEGGIALRSAPQSSYDTCLNILWNTSYSRQIHRL